MKNANSAIRLLSDLSTHYPTTLAIEYRSISASRLDDSERTTIQRNALAYVYRISVSTTPVDAMLKIERLADDNFVSSDMSPLDSLYGCEISYEWQDDKLIIRHQHTYYYPWSDATVILEISAIH